MADLAATALTITFASIGKTVFGNKRVGLGYITIANPSGYNIPTGGLSLTPQQLCMRNVDVVILSADAGTQSATAPNMYQYDYVNQKINAQANNDNVAPTDGEKIRFMAVGLGVK